MLPADVASMKKIAGVRMYVERKMQRIKLFSFLSKELPNSMLDTVGQIIFVCSTLTNFQASLAA